MFDAAKAKIILSSGQTLNLEIIPITFFTKKLKIRWLRELEGLGLVIGKQSDNFYSFVYKDVEIFKGTKAEAEAALKEYFENSKKGGLEKYLDEVLERRKLDDYINNLGFKFRELGLKFTHTIKKAFDGSLDISMFLVDKERNKLFQGYSNVSKGILENVFDVSIQKNDVSTAMYKFLDKVGFDSVIGSYYGNSTLNVNYDEFMKVYDKVLDNRIDAAFATPAGKALNKALDNKFVPYVTKIDEINKKVIVIWKKKV